MITSNVYNRVFFIRSKLYATAFTVDLDRKQYLITATHVLDEAIEQKGIKLFLNNAWLDLDVTMIGKASDDVDITVLAVNAVLTESEFLLEASSKGLGVSQDAYLVGYPFKTWTDAGSASAGRPVPFIRKGIVASAFNTGDGISRIFVDAFSNEGFSGGPIVYRLGKDRDFRIAGVLTKYRIESETVVGSAGGKTQLSVPYNAGFATGCDIHYAIDLIRSNPLGTDIRDDA